MLLFELEKESVWTQLKNTAEPIIMYGTGNGADKVFEVFRKYGITVTGVTASDGFVRERFFHGFKVKPVSEFEKEYENFTVVITFGSSIKSVIDNIKKLSEKHTVLVPCVPVVGNVIFNDDFISENEYDINKAYTLFADEKSKEVYASYVNFEYSGKPEYLFGCESDENEAFINCIHLGENENYVDIGAYRGDTIEKFLSYTGGKYGFITAVEPDIKSFKKLCENCKELENFEAVNKAVTRTDGKVGFSSLAGRQSSIGGNDVIDGVCLKTLCEKRKPTYIKIDSEGEEINILEGASKILSECLPKLNIAAYHKNEDIFRIPVIISEISTEYRIYLRHHPYIPAWDTIIYCER